MKKLFLIFLLAAIPVSLIAGNIDFKKEVNKPNQKPTITKSIEAKKTYTDGSKKLSPMYVSASQYKIIDTIHGSRSHFDDNQPFAYEPISGNLFYGVTNLYANHDETSQYDYFSAFEYYWSPENGDNWSGNILMTVDTGCICFNPSIAVVNLYGNDDVGSSQIFLYSPIYKHNLATTKLDFQGGLFCETKHGGATDRYIYKSADNVFGQNWYIQKAFGYRVSDDEHYFYTYGSMLNDENYNTSNYGITKNGLNDQFWIVPDQWNYTNFWQTDEPKKYTYNDQIYVKPDPTNPNKLYAIATNLFEPRATYSERVPGVTISTNGGNTWSAWEIMDSTLITQYAQNEGMDDGRILPYRPEGFVVTGANSFSFITRIVVWDEDINNWGVTLAEVSKVNNVWQPIKFIAPLDFYYIGADAPMNEIEYYTFNVFRDVSEVDGVVKDSIIPHPIGNEIQLSITKDGQYLVAKWIDVDYNNVMHLVYNPGLWTENDVQVDPDSVYGNKLNFAYRHITNDDTWTLIDKVPFTGDEAAFIKGTEIPDIVPSLENIPLINLYSILAYPTQEARGSKNYDAAIFQRCIDTWMQVRSRKVSLVQSGVEPNPAPESSFQLGDVVPNPVQNSASFTFAVNKPGNVKLALYNSLGEQVAMLFDGFISTGVHSYSLNVDEFNLISGTYYYTLTDGNQSVTKLLNVIK